MRPEGSLAISLADILPSIPIIMVDVQPSILVSPQLIDGQARRLLCANIGAALVYFTRAAADSLRCFRAPSSFRSRSAWISC